MYDSIITYTYIHTCIQTDSSACKCLEHMKTNAIKNFHTTFRHTATTTTTITVMTSTKAHDHQQE